jgi:hypothetical protein
MINPITILMRVSIVPNALYIYVSIATHAIPIVRLLYCTTSTTRQQFNRITSSGLVIIVLCHVRHHHITYSLQTYQCIPQSINQLINHAHLPS